MLFRVIASSPRLSVGQSKMLEDQSDVSSSALSAEELSREYQLVPSEKQEADSMFT